MFARFLLSLVTFVVAAAAIWFALVIGVSGYWQWAGVHDHDGGGAMALGLIIAPAIAVVGGAVVAVMTGRMLARRPAAQDGDAPATRGRDKRYFIIFGAAIGGWLVGLYLMRVFLRVFGPERYDTYWKALLHAWAPDVAGVILAFVAGFAAARAMGKSSRTPG